MILLLVVAFKDTNNFNPGANLVNVSYYFGATNVSSSVSNAVTTTPILALDANRSGATVCNIAVGTVVWLFPQATTATSAIQVNAGIPLTASSSGNGICRDFPGFKGNLMGIATATSTVTVSSWK